MPVWHEITKHARNADGLVLLGVIQEQHPDRCRLFAQWKGLDWPIVHDPVNLLGARAVPMFVAIDEAGTVIDANLQTSELADFLSRPRATAVPRDADGDHALPATATLDARARASHAANDWIAAGDRRVFWSGADQLNAAIDRYSQAIAIEPQNGAALFRLGVAFRLREDSLFACAGDFQSAIDAWGRALDVDPNQYIYRRRIQQYGPRLNKPYPFYDWIQQAREEIRARDEQPVDLDVEPVGAEIALPARTFTQASHTVEAPDPQGRIDLDLDHVEARTAVAPGIINKGEVVRVHLQLRPRDQTHWNNEAEPLQIWIDLPQGWQTESQLIQAPQPNQSESREPRSVDFEVRTAAETEVDSISAYALFHICEQARGQCLYRRKNISIPIRFRTP